MAMAIGYQPHQGRGIRGVVFGAEGSAICSSEDERYLM